MKMYMVKLLERLEGFRESVYMDTSGCKTVGIGFNMDAPGARDAWSRAGIMEDFDDVYYGNEMITHFSACELVDVFWTKCEKMAKDRCEELDVEWDRLPDWHKFVLADIVFNVGNISGWTKVVVETEPKKVLFEARRKQHEIDSRVCKIGKFFEIVEDVEGCVELGLTEAKYAV